MAAYRLLREHLYRYLDEAEYLAMKCADWTDTDSDTARDLIPDLVDAIRTSLAAHTADDADQCVPCERPWPCRTVQTIHGVITDPSRNFQPLLTKEV